NLEEFAEGGGGPEGPASPRSPRLGTSPKAVSPPFHFPLCFHQLQMVGQMRLFLSRGNDVMKHIAQEDFAERVPVNQQDFNSTFGPSCRPHVGLSHEKGLNHSEGRLGNVKEGEIVVWILVVLLAFVTFTAFYLLWLKAD